jgi:hypothetical protein
MLATARYLIGYKKDIGGTRTSAFKTGIAVNQKLGGERLQRGVC